MAEVLSKAKADDPKLGLTTHTRKAGSAYAPLVDALVAGDVVLWSADDKKTFLKESNVLRKAYFLRTGFACVSVQTKDGRRGLRGTQETPAPRKPRKKKDATSTDAPAADATTADAK